MPRTDLTQVDVLVSKSQATIRCTVNGRRFDETGPLEQILARWKTFMDELPSDSQSSAQFAMTLAKAAMR